VPDEEKIIDENGNEVLESDRDFLYQQAQTREQRDWEARWFFATDDPQKQAFQRQLRDLQTMCLRAATAIEMHWISPRAYEAIRKAIQLWPSGAQDNDHRLHQVHGHALRRIARAQGYDYDLQRAVEEAWPDGDWPRNQDASPETRTRLWQRAQELAREDEVDEDDDQDRDED
jgi:hypothetical protein